MRQPGEFPRQGGDNLARKQKAPQPAKTRSFMERVLDTVERVGNKVPHPVIIFLLLIGLVAVLSHIFYLMGSSVTYEAVNPDTNEVEQTTTAAQSLLTADGLRFIYSG